MIKSFKCKHTAAIFQGLEVKNFNREVQVIALRKLIQLEAASTIDFMRVPSGNRLEKLGGDRAGFWSIRVNQQFRICFRFEDGHAYEVELVDYH
ncbi:MAG: type II toxin-antitoxin system RelE/ParE family toxin [Methylophilaceae bacterium]